MARAILRRKQSAIWTTDYTKIKIIFSIVDDVIYIEYIKNTWLSEETMLKRMGYCWE